MKVDNKKIYSTSTCKKENKVFILQTSTITLQKIKPGAKEVQLQKIILWLRHILEKIFVRQLVL